MITAQMDVWDVRCGSILVCFNKECFGTRYEGCHARYAGYIALCMPKYIWSMVFHWGERWFASSRSGAKHKSSRRLPDFQHPCIHPLSKVLQNHPFTLLQVFHNQPEILLRTQKLLNMLGCWPTGGGKGKKQLHVTSPLWNFYCWAMCIRI